MKNTYDPATISSSLCENVDWEVGRMFHVEHPRQRTGYSARFMAGLGVE
jgi:hypothetical protein